MYIRSIILYFDVFYILNRTKIASKPINRECRAIRMPTEYQLFTRCSLCIQEYQTPTSFLWEIPTPPESTQHISKSLRNDHVIPKIIEAIKPPALDVASSLLETQLVTDRNFSNILEHSLLNKEIHQYIMSYIYTYTYMSIYISIIYNDLESIMYKYIYICL